MNNKNSAYNLYLKDIHLLKSMKKDEEKQAFIDYREGGSRTAYNKIFTRNAKFVVKIAHKYANQGVEIEDLIGAGNIGMAKAIESYEYNRGMKFISWAVWRIRQGILNELAEQSRDLKITGVEANKKSQLDKVIKKLTQELTREPTVIEISERSKVPVKTLEHMDALNPHISLDTPIEGNHTIGDLIEDNSDVQETSSVAEKIINFLNSATFLTDRERDVISMYFGICYETSYTLEEIGQKYGVTREAIRVIKKKTLAKLIKYNNQLKVMKQPYIEMELITS